MNKVTHSMKIMIEISMNLSRKEEDFIQIKSVEVTYFLNENHR